MGLIDWLRGKDDVEQRAIIGPTLSIADPALAEYLGLSYGSGLEASEFNALGIPAYYRAVMIIAGTIASLPLKTYRQLEDGSKERVGSFLDRPSGPYNLSAYSWKETVLLHLLNQGEVFLMHINNNAGALIGLWPVHRSAVDVKWNGVEKLFNVHMTDGTTKTFDQTNMTQIMGPTLDGLRGIAPITLFRRAIRTGLAGELAANRTLSNGLLIAGLVTPEADMTEDEATAVKEGLQAKMAGAEHAGDIAVVNRALKFTPWSMSNEDAQFIESREFQITEFARMLGVPPHLLGQTEKQTSWGTGVAEQNLGLARYTFMPWTSRIEEPLSDLLPKPRFAEFDYSGLLQGSPAEEIDLLLKQTGNKPILTVDEARAIRNLPPLTTEQKAEMFPTPQPNSNDGNKGGDG